MTNKLIIAHANCTDGFTAAWAAYSPGDEIVYAKYDDKKPPPDVRGRDVAIVDFCYRRDVLVRLHTQAASLIVLDHHKTSMEAVEGLDYAIFDMERSGARMAWEHFHPGEPVPLLVRYVEDRDLWKWEMHGSREVNAYLRWLPKTLECWDTTHTNFELHGEKWAIEAGEGCLTAVRGMAAEAALDMKRYWFRGYDIGFVNRGPEVASDIAETMLLTNPMLAAAVVWWQDAEGVYQYSLRSDGKKCDVGHLARLFGGGGHAGASGFRSDHSPHTLHIYDLGR